MKTFLFLMFLIMGIYFLTFIHIDLKILFLNVVYMILSTFAGVAVAFFSFFLIYKKKELK